MGPEEGIKVKIVEAPTRELTGIIVKVVSAIGICFSLYQLYALQVSPQDPWILRSMHFAFASVLGFLLYPATFRSPRNRIQIIDIVLILASLGVLTYTLHQFKFLAWRLTMVPITTDVIVSTVLIILVLELTRRCVGLPLVILCVFFLFYSWGGQFFPSFLWHRGYPWSRTAGYLLSYEGINGMTLGVSSTFVFMFILFGAFLQVSGTGEFLVQISYSIAGRFRGGPAKVAVVASSLMGTISGSAVGNTVTTGSMTIPLMMRVGYKPWFAGAVEAVASTGGQIMPPIMGAGAFLMAEIIGQPYVQIIVAAIIPALLYYIALFWMVDIEAVKLGLGGLPGDQLPNFKEVFLRGWLFLVPIAVLIWALVVARYSPVKAATVSMLTCIVVTWFMPAARMGLRKILDGLERGARNVVSVAAVCAAAGIIVGVLGLTGMGVKIAGVLVAAAGGNLFIALLISMFVCLLLGMGLPTTPAYAVVASVVAPGLIKMGLEPLTAHLFCFFFACIGPVTPPVAVASYAGAAIAKTSPTKVGWVGLRLALVGFIVPFAFVYGPSLLMRGNVVTILFTVSTAIVGILAIGMALQGMILKEKANFISRSFLFASALLLITPGLLTDLFGFTAFAMGLVLHFMVRKIVRKKADRPAIA